MASAERIIDGGSNEKQITYHLDLFLFGRVIRTRCLFCVNTRIPELSWSSGCCGSITREYTHQWTGKDGHDRRATWLLAGDL
jgi:hypothetical protein